MDALKKIEKINQLSQHLELWQVFALSISDILKDVDRGKKNYRSVLHAIRVFFGIYKDQFQTVQLNSNEEFLKLNFDFAMKQIDKIKLEIQKL